MPTGLKDIADTQLDASVLESISHSISFGPLTIKASLDLQTLEITFEVYLVGVKIGSGVLDPSNPSVKIKGGVAGFKAEVQLSADFNKKQVTYKVEVCAPLAGCKDYKGTLFSWS